MIKLGFNKFSIIPIVKEHLKTFKKVDGNYFIKDLIIILGIPFLGIVIFNCIFKEGLPNNIINSLLTVFIILTPLLFTLLPLIYSLIENKYVSSKGRFLLREFKANTLFTIVLSFIFLIILLICSLEYYRILLSLIIYFLFIEIILHLCLIIIRFNILMDSLIELQNKYDNN